MGLDGRMRDMLIESTDPSVREGIEQGIDDIKAAAAERGTYPPALREDYFCLSVGSEIRALERTADQLAVLALQNAAEALLQLGGIVDSQRAMGNSATASLVNLAQNQRSAA